MRFPYTDPSAPKGFERYPVGALYASRDPTDPQELFGGVWVRVSQGRAIVGVDETDPDFDTPGKESGLKEVVLTEAQGPVHAHAVNDPQHAHVENSNQTTTGSLRGWGAPDASTNQSTPTGFSTAPALTGITIANAGGGEAHPNVQPSKAYYIWERIE